MFSELINFDKITMERSSSLARDVLLWVVFSCIKMNVYLCLFVENRNQSLISDLESRIYF